MAAPNSEPIFSRVADVQWAENIVTANNTIDLTSGTSYLAFTADSTNGGFVRNARVKVNPANSSAATVVRFWLNNGSTTGTAANSAIIGELGLPATTTSATAPLPDFDYGLNMALPPGYKIYVTVGTAPGGSCELTVTIFGGKY
jgi:hypothetical protein